VSRDVAAGRADSRARSRPRRSGRRSDAAPPLVELSKRSRRGRSGAFDGAPARVGSKTGRRRGVGALVAVEDEDLAAERVAERLDGLGLARARGAVGVAAEAHVHALREREVALVRQGRVDELARVALVLVRVAEGPVGHADLGAAGRADVVAELLVPGPVVRVAAPRAVELVEHVHVVDEVHDERLDLELRHGHAAEVLARVRLELRARARGHVAEAAVEARLDAVGEADELADAEHLGRVRLEVGLARAPVCKSTSELGRPDQTLKFSSSVKSRSIRLIFGRIDCSRRVLEAQRKILRRNCRIRSH